MPRKRPSAHVAASECVRGAKALRHQIKEGQSHVSYRVKTKSRPPQSREEKGHIKGQQGLPRQQVCQGFVKQEKEHEQSKARSSRSKTQHKVCSGVCAVSIKQEEQLELEQGNATIGSTAEVPGSSIAQSNAIEEPEQSEHAQEDLFGAPLDEREFEHSVSHLGEPQP